MRTTALEGIIWAIARVTRITHAILNHKTGNARSIEIVEKLDVLTSDVSSLRSEVESYKQQVEILKNKNIILKEQLGSGD